MDADLSTCLKKLGIFPPDVLMQAGVTSLAIVKSLCDDEIRHVWDAICKTGVCFAYVLVRRVQNLAYYLKHLDRVQREFQLENVTLQTLEMKAMKGFEERQLQKDTWHVLSKSSARTLIEDLRRSLGSNGIPLLYVLRDPEPPDRCTVYGTVYDEMIARAPLQGFRLERDNETVWYILLQYILPSPTILRSTRIR